MKKKLLAALLALTMVISQNMVWGLEVHAADKSARTAFEQMVDDNPVYALIKRDCNVTKKPGRDGVTLTSLLSGTQVSLTGVEDRDGVRYYRVEFLKRGQIFCGYLPENMLVTADKRVEDWKRTYPMTGVVYRGATQNQTDLSSFPSSYQSYIKKLIEAHPTWTFVAMNTDLDWNTVIKNEMSPERNLVPLESMDSWKESNDIVSDPYWVQASESIVRYYMDPRNFLNEDYVFQFELLTYNKESHKESGVKAIVKNTFMETNKLEDGKTYAKVFMEIGKKLNVSPYHLASRVRQEQGLEGKSDLISGTYPGYEGYYNYFNIQAYGATREEIITNGLNEAVEGGWNTRYLALYGGSEKVAKNYIAVGQDTLYLQKFDVDASDNNLYWHQYMQNLLAAANESKSVKKAYEDMEVLENSFVFRVPVYNNMPSSQCKVPTDKMDKSSLKAKVDDFSSIKLTWSEITGAQGYEIYRSTSPNGKFKLLTTIKSVGETSYLDKIGVNKTGYYKVRGYKTFQGVTAYSPYSDVKDATTVIAEPELKTVSAQTYTNVSLEWKKVKNVTGYQIYRKIGSKGQYTKIQTVKGSSKVTWTDSTAEPNLTYYYKVRAYKTLDGKNYYSKYGKEQSVSTKMSAPTISKVTMSGSGALTVAWSKNSLVTGYEIARANTRNGKYKVIKSIGKKSTVSYQDSDLDSDRSYYYKVRAYVTVNGVKKYSSYSNLVMGRTYLSTPMITNIKNASPTSVTLNWKKTESAVGYQIYRATSVNGTYTKVVTIKKNTTVKYTDKNLTPNKTYYYKVRAYSNTGKKTLYSAESYVNCATPTFGTPELTSISKIKNSTVQLNWEKVDGAAGYQIYCATKENGDYQVVGTIKKADITNFQHKGLKPNTAYYYKVRAFVNVKDKKKYSPYSQIWYVRTAK